MSTQIMPSTRTERGYADVLAGNRILCIPSCIVVQLIARCFSEISMVNMAGERSRMAPDTASLVRGLAGNFDAARRAHADPSVHFFPGDWRNDKSRARRLLYDVMSAIGYMAELVGQADRETMYGAVRVLVDAWTELEKLLDEKIALRRRQGGPNKCGSIYFRNENADTWKSAMANAILELHGDSVYSSPEDVLLLVCYRRVRGALLQGIEAMERKTWAVKRFPQDKIVCAFDDDLPITCPTCTRMTDTVRKSTRKTIRTGYLKQNHRRETERGQTRVTRTAGALPLPPSLRGLENG